MNKQISTRMGIVVVVVAAIVAGAIMWFAMTPQTQAPTQPTPIASLQGQTGNQNVALGTNQTQPSSAKIASSENVNTYKNDQWGIQLDYPKTWTIDKERSTADEVVFSLPRSAGTESHESLSFQKNANNLSLDKMAAEMVLADPSSIYKKSNLTIAGEKALKEDSSEFATAYYVFLHKGNAFMITTQGAFTNQIISTIKFTK